VRRGVFIFSTVFGLVATVLGAWLPRVPGFDTSMVTMRSGLAARSRFSNVFELNTAWTTWVMILPIFEEPNQGSRGKGYAPVEVFEDLPYWAQREREGDTAFRIVTEATGWPLRCMRMTTFAYNDRAAIERGIVRPFAGQRRESGETPSMFDGAAPSATIGGTAFPVGVILPGLMTNILFFTGLPLGVVWFRGWVLRRERLREGLCRGCGYDRRAVTGTRCPECGEE